MSLIQTIPGTMFEVGKTYATTSICDSQCVYSYRILSRTEKSVRITVDSKVVSRFIFVRDGIERIHPLKKYSMCPTISANRVPA